MLLKQCKRWRLMIFGFIMAVLFTRKLAMNSPAPTPVGSRLTQSSQIYSNENSSARLSQKRNYSISMEIPKLKNTIQQSQANSIVSETANSSRLQQPATALTTKRISGNDFLYPEDAFKNVYNPLQMQETITYLDNYRNPCFWQRLDSKNPYYAEEIDIRFKEISRRGIENIMLKRFEEGKQTRLRCFPAFFVAGIQKCGSTELYRILALHNQMATLAIKENHWWNRGRYKAHMRTKGIRISLEGYLDLFDLPAEEIRSHSRKDPSYQDGYHAMITGDVSPALLWDQLYWKLQPENKNKTEPEILVPHLIYSILPQAKFLIMLRNPTERLYSDWLFFGKRGGTALDFDHAVKRAIKWFNDCSQTQPVRACAYNSIENDPYVSDRNRETQAVWYHPAFRLRMGLYYVFIQDLLDVFPRQQVMIMRLEDYSLDRQNMLEKVFTFLDLDPDPRVGLQIAKEKPRNQNTKGYTSRGNMLPQTKSLLDDFYAAYNNKLAKLLNDDRFLWN